MPRRSPASFRRAAGPTSAPTMRRSKREGAPLLPPPLPADSLYACRWLSLVNAACCTTAASACSGGLPTSCDQECANVLKPFQKSCKSQLRAGGMTQTIAQASTSCPAAPANTRGCPQSIPALAPGATQSCGSGGGFWPIGSVCPVSCGAAGGGAASCGLPPRRHAGVAGRPLPLDLDGYPHRRPPPDHHQRHPSAAHGVSSGYRR